jgi:hypothetical protein
MHLHYKVSVTMDYMERTTAYQKACSAAGIQMLCETQDRLADADMDVTD